MSVDDRRSASQKHAGVGVLRTVLPEVDDFHIQPMILLGNGDVHVRRAAHRAHRASDGVPHNTHHGRVHVGAVGQRADDGVDVGGGLRGAGLVPRLEGLAEALLDVFDAGAWIGGDRRPDVRKSRHESHRRCGSRRPVPRLRSDGRDETDDRRHAARSRRQHAGRRGRGRRTGSRGCGWFRHSDAVADREVAVGSRSAATLSGNPTAARPSIGQTLQLRGLPRAVRGVPACGACALRAAGREGAKGGPPAAEGAWRLRPHVFDGAIPGMRTLGATARPAARLVPRKGGPSAAAVARRPRR
mmetsp:Transcript_169756/g.539169  ORF Transcript_169756/g.539169 Transcript_169756/m.539169 type:complete len:300 (+) Transcript_169756:761-1660(+)